MSGWAGRVIDSLLVAKAAGMDFESAWSAAVALHPPGGRDLGAVRPTLFSEDGEYDESLVEFTRRVAADAWYGRRPLLRHLPGLVDMIDAGESAGVAVHRGRVARPQLVA